MSDEVVTAEADVAAAEAALAQANAAEAHAVQRAETPVVAPETPAVIDPEQVDRPADANPITEEVQTRYLNDRGPVE